MLLTDESRARYEPLIARKFHDMPFSEYLSHKVVSSHGLMNIRRSPKYYKWKNAHPDSTRALDFGTLVHTLVLEPDTLEKRCRVKKKVDGRTKEGKAYNAEFDASVPPGFFVVNDEEFEAGLRCRDELAKHPYTKSIIGRGKREQTGFFIHPQLEMVGRLRADVLFENEGWIGDVKTCQDASKQAFQRTIVNRCYDLQGAWYTDGFRLLMGFTPRGFLNIAIESNPPYGIGVYAYEPSVIEHGRHKYLMAGATLKQCLETDTWPDYSDRIEGIDLPGWAVYQEQFE